MFANKYIYINKGGSLNRALKRKIRNEKNIF